MLIKGPVLYLYVCMYVCMYVAMYVCMCIAACFSTCPMYIVLYLLPAPHMIVPSIHIIIIYIVSSSVTSQISSRDVYSLHSHKHGESTTIIII